MRFAEPIWESLLAIVNLDMEEAAIENRAKVSLFSFFKCHVVPYSNLSRVYQHNTTHFFDWITFELS